ncbi:MAG: hypothetical protein KDH84_22760, partial [Calditrichaeota bacterium]|nr:hypothetical protein [Calditrichota bacterium]
MFASLTMFALRALSGDESSTPRYRHGTARSANISEANIAGAAGKYRAQRKYPASSSLLHPISL